VATAPALTGVFQDKKVDVEIRAKQNLTLISLILFSWQYQLSVPDIHLPGVGSKILLPSLLT
jgi:hypothetical protein